MEGYISQHNIKNFINKDPILDWFNLYGATNYKMDTQFIDYDKDKNFSELIKEKTIEQKDLVYKKFLKKYRKVGIVEDNFEIKQAHLKTKLMMKNNVKCIMNGVLIDKANKMYGKYDFLLRHDKTGLYRAVMVKFITLRYNKKGTDIKNVGNVFYYKNEITYLNQILENVCKKNINSGFIIDRSLNMHDVKNIEDPVELDKAIEWYKDVRDNGSFYEIGKRPEMFPNMSYKSDFPWHNAKKNVAKDIGELTLMWKCGVKQRTKFHEQGVFNIDAVKNFEDTETGDTQMKILNANRQSPESSGSSILKPSVIQNNYCDWKNDKYLDFFVDFEQVSNLNGKEMVFQLGCGFEFEGKWLYKSFFAETMELDEEERIITEWLRYMDKIGHKIKLQSRVFHWSPAEKSSFEKIKKKYLISKDLNWVDMLVIFKKEPVTIKDCYDFSLKSVARAFKKHGLIETIWGNTYADGMSVMVTMLRNNIRNESLRYEITKYNEIDCKVMWEMLKYLRNNNC